MAGLVPTSGGAEGSEAGRRWTTLGSCMPKTPGRHDTRTDSPSTHGARLLT